MTTYPIEPAGRPAGYDSRLRTVRETLRRCEPGDAFTVPCVARVKSWRATQNTIYLAAEQLGLKVQTLRTPEGVRAWRLR